MTKIYVMESCPDRTQVKQLYKDNPEYELIDIGQSARNLKEFMRLRDNHPAFVKVKEKGNIGIPCFVKPDGSVIISLKHYDASIADAAAMPEYSSGAACNLDGTGC